jgi:predicted extracellular nuclease
MNNGRLNIRLAAGLLAMIMVLTLVPSARMPARAASGVVINEFVFNHTGTDTNEYVEIFGDPNTDYSASWILEIEGDSSGAGVIDGIWKVGTTDASGFWTTGFLNNELENGTLTLLLVEGFSGSPGDDLDGDNDGVLDSTPWTSVLDDVAVTDGDLTDRTYTSVVLSPGYDGITFTPGGASRIPDGADSDTVNDWLRNDFDGAGLIGFSGTPELGEAFNTPGTTNQAVPPPPPPPIVTIMEIQGASQFSPFDGQVVETSGVVTLFTANGANFWLQDPGGDGNSATSDGIFVAGGGFPAEGPRPSVGAFIRIIAQVEEQQFGNALPLTRLHSVALIEVLSSGNSLPAPIPLKDLPDESIAEGISFWEPLEGMLASVDNAPVVAATSGFGEFAMLAKDDAKPHSGFFPETQQILVHDLGQGDVDYNPERILVDDSTLEKAIVVMPGDRVRSLVGAVDYTFGNYKLQPASFDVETHNLPNLPASTRSGPNGDTVITTFNVENLFDLVDEPGKDDEGSTPTPEELETKLAKLALAIQDELELPEILVVQEVENTEILQELGDRVNAVAGTGYVATSFETSDARGIEVGFLWDDNRVDLLEAYQLAGTDVEDAFGPSSPSPGREPLVGVFEVEGRQITIVGNHFKSKSGDDPLFGVNWPPIRVTEEQRKAQARVVRDFVSSILDTDPNALVMVAGDLNDFQFGEPGEGADHPIAILEGIEGGVPLTDLVNLEKDDERYTYVFDSNSQVLDHMLVSPALYELFAAVDILHFDAGFPSNLGEDPATPLRASDHDPLEGRFNLK